MNYILRVFFYSFGLTMLLYAWGLNPETAQFKDLLVVLHGANFWDIVVIIAIASTGTDIAFSGHWAKAVDIVFDAGKRLYGKNKDKSAN